MRGWSGGHLTPCSMSEECVDHHVGDESSVALRGPAATNHEQLVELGCAVGPEHVRGLRDSDAVSEVAGSLEATRVECHALEAIFVHLFEQHEHFGVGCGGGADQQEDRCGVWHDFGSERAPCLDDLARVPL